MKESNVLKLCMLAASDCGAIVFRNNSGAYMKDNHFIRYGVGGVGGSDLIGWTINGQFLAIETKAKGGVASPAQLNFLKRVNDAGGIGILAYCPEDVTGVLK